MSLRREDLDRLLEVLGVTESEELDCTEFLDRVAGYVEWLEAGGEPPAEHRKIAQHLLVCPECLEEYEALYRAVHGDEPPAR